MPNNKKPPTTCSDYSGAPFKYIIKHFRVCNNEMSYIEKIESWFKCIDFIDKSGIWLKFKKIKTKNIFVKIIVDDPADKSYKIKFPELFNLHEMLKKELTEKEKNHG